MTIKAIKKEAEFYQKRWEISPRKELSPAGRYDYKEHSDISLLGIISAFNETIAGRVDLSGINLGPTIPDSNQRIGMLRYKREIIENVDFSYSSSIAGFHLDDCRISNSIFDKSIWWNNLNRGSSFVNCSFRKILLYHSGLFIRACFNNCVFDGMIVRGNGISFGTKSKFINCSFRNIDIRHGEIPYSVSFENCVFSGKFDATGMSRIFGKKRAFFKNFDTVPDLLSQTYRPVRFVDCDFAQLDVIGLQVDKDVIFENCNGTEKFFL
jgi:uncharacterized protein YjbI with pentapeptide repeats